ncbi:MAG: hypothetical protein KKH61_20680, partial [Gammaproteobacteria bacterium]|nr:hypothetical protein [Gammaproteobacteria bacterium]
VGILFMVRVRLSGFYFILFSILGFVLLITLLQEAKNFDGYSHGFISLSNSLYRQFSPIIINNLVGLELRVSSEDLFGSILPFGKTLFSVPGLVEKMSYYHLSSTIFNNGTRLGSASSVYFGRDYYFFYFLVVFLLIVLWFCYMKMGKRSLNVFVVYMSFYAPYFIRRGVGLYIVDLIVLLFFIAFFLFLFRSFKKV